MATTTARAAARRAATATTASTTDTPAAPEADSAPVVPPPAQQSPEDQVNERLDVLEELAAHQAESTQQVAASVEASAAQVAQATETLTRFLEGAEESNREVRGIALAVAERVAALERRAENTGQSLSDLDSRLGDVARTVGGVVSSALGREVQGEVLEIQGEHVHRAIGQVMNAVREIGKSGVHNGGGQRYNFRQLDEIMDAIGGAMRTYGLYVLPSILHKDVDRWTTKNSQNRDTTVTSVVTTVRYSLVSTVDGSRVDMDMVGEGRDNGDKATSKSVAMAYKYALLQAFCIPVQDVTGMDTENFDAPTEAPTGRPTFDPNPQYQRGDAQHARTADQRAEYARNVDQLQQGAQRYAEQTQPAAPQVNPLEAATRALAASRRPGLDMAGLNAIVAHASNLGITQVEVEGQPLAQHFWAVKGILDQQAQTRAANAAPQVKDNPADELPWDGNDYGTPGPDAGWPHP